MSRKKSNRLSLEQHKRAYRENQAAIAKALEQNAELEKAITEEENLEIVGIIRKYQVGIDNLEQIMQGIQPKGESLFSEEKLNSHLSRMILVIVFLDRTGNDTAYAAVRKARRRR